MAGFRGFLRSTLARRGKLLDRIGRAGLRLYLYRENLNFDPDRNGEHWLVNRLRALDVNPSQIVDIGANEGRWSAFVQSVWPDARIDLFDPMPSIVTRLRERFAGNALVSVHQAAVGGVAADVAIHENREQSSHSFVSMNGSPTNGDLARMIPGSDILKEIGASRIDLCKIDAEGFDLSILASMEPLFRQRGIGTLQFEHYAFAVAYQQPLFAITAMLRDCGYRIAKLFPEGLREITDDTPDWGHLVGPNFVACQDANLFEALVSRR